MTRRRPGQRIAFGENVYPSPTARNGEQLGRTPFRLCRQCGTPNDTRKVATFNAGDGVVDIADTDPQDREVSRGCRFCGSGQWLVGNPPPLPDDKNLPSRENRFRRRRW